jgi:hypothetical protein
VLHEPVPIVENVHGVAGGVIGFFRVCLAETKSAQKSVHKIVHVRAGAFVGACTRGWGPCAVYIGARESQHPQSTSLRAIEGLPAGVLRHAMDAVANLAEVDPLEQTAHSIRDCVLERRAVVLH